MEGLTQVDGGANPGGRRGAAPSPGLRGLAVHVRLAAGAVDLARLRGEAPAPGGGSALPPSLAQVAAPSFPRAPESVSGSQSPAEAPSLAPPRPACMSSAVPPSQHPGGSCVCGRPRKMVEFEVAGAPLVAKRKELGLETHRLA